MIKKEEVFKLIDGVMAFRGIKSESLEKLKDIGVVKEYKKNTVLFMEKDEVDKCYAILKGKVELSRYSGWGQKRIFFILDKGEMVNEVVFDNMPVSVVCETYEESIIVEFKKEEFLKIMENDFSLTMNIMNSMGKKQRRLYRQLKNTVPIKMDKKLAAKLWKMSRDYGVKDGDMKRIDMKISVTDLSYMLGATRETISRAMKVLIENGIVQWRGRILLVDEEKILKYYRN